MPYPSTAVFPGPGTFPGIDVQVSPIAEELWNALGAWRDADINVWTLLQFCEAFIGALQVVEDLARDTDAGPGWSAVMDLNRAPNEWLPWLAQFAGVRIPPGLTDAQQRAWIGGTDGFRRGSLGALITAVQSTLTGTKRVYVRERDGSPYRLSVDTRTTETPDPARTLAAILSQKPAGIVLTYNVVDAITWDEATTTWDTAPAGMTWDTVGEGI